MGCSLRALCSYTFLNLFPKIPFFSLKYVFQPCGLGCSSLPSHSVWALFHYCPLSSVAEEKSDVGGIIFPFEVSLLCLCGRLQNFPLCPWRNFSRWLFYGAWVGFLSLFILNMQVCLQLSRAFQSESWKSAKLSLLENNYYYLLLVPISVDLESRTKIRK